MSIEQKINGDVGTLILGEEIDLDTSPTVRENIKDLLNSTKIVEVNLANVSYIDS
jgi:anti-sigma B factor antagonist